MPLKAVDRPDGKTRPAVVCDWCGREIATAADGNCHYRHDDRGRLTGGAVFFTHKACCHAFETANPGGWVADELGVWLVGLVDGLGGDRKASRRRAALLDSLG